MKNPGKISYKPLLIHGYGVGLEGLFNPSFGNTGGFLAFGGEIDSGRAVVFSWYEKVIKLGGFQSLNLLQYVRLYFYERRVVADLSFYKKLSGRIAGAEVDTLIGHSLGAEIIYNLVCKHGLPKKIKRVVLVQADLPKDRQKELFEVCCELGVELFHVYNPFDYTLWLGSLAHLSLRTGVYKTRFAHGSGVFYPKKVLVHQGAITDLRLGGFIEKLVGGRLSPSQ